MVTIEICSFNEFLKCEPLIKPPSVTEVTFVIFQQNNQKGLRWALSVLPFQGRQWKQLLKALRGASIPQIIWTAVYLHGELQSFQFKDPSGSCIRPSHHLKEQAETHQGDAKI